MERAREMVVFPADHTTQVTDATNLVRGVLATVWRQSPNQILQHGATVLETALDTTHHLGIDVFPDVFPGGLSVPKTAQFSFVAARGDYPYTPTIIFGDPSIFDANGAEGKFENLEPEQRIAVQLALLLANTFLNDADAFSQRLRQVYEQLGSHMGIDASRISAYIPPEILLADFGRDDVLRLRGQGIVPLPGDDVHPGTQDLVIPDEFIDLVTQDPERFSWQRGRYTHFIATNDDESLRVSLANLSPEERAASAATRFIQELYLDITGREGFFFE